MEIEVSNKMKKLLTQFLLLALLGACAPTKDGARDGANPNPDASPRPGNNATGTIDGGGGNTINGKPLDLYRKNLMQLPSVKKHVLPLIRKVMMKLPPLAGDMYHIMTERSWFFVPVELNQIPGFDINAPFEKTQQAAFQTMREVWLNSLIFDKMTEEDQSALIVHELMMGIRRMEFTEPYDHCLATAAMQVFADNTGDALKDARRQCRERYPAVKIIGGGSIFDNLQKKSLDKEDYPNVRKVTYELIEGFDKIDFEELAYWLAKHKFRNYEMPKAK